jgi:hypothetical protein
MGPIGCKFSSHHFAADRSGHFSGALFAFITSLMKLSLLCLWYVSGNRSKKIWDSIRLEINPWLLPSLY